LKSFRQLLEVIKLKLGGLPSREVEGFVAELNSLTTEHPFNHKARVYGRAIVEVRPFERKIHIVDVYTNTPSQGHGSKAMRLLCKLADKHKVDMTLFAWAYKDDQNLMNTDELKDWYTTFGFKAKTRLASDDGWDMVRVHKQIA